MGEMQWTVLVVDDEAINVEILQAFLKRAGYRVLSAGNGQEAVELARTKVPDLILLDIMMPGESGFETCERLKADSATADIPVIFLSALDNVQDKVRGFKAGGVDYVPKPFQKDEILARVSTHLTQRRAFQQRIDEQAQRLNQVKEGQQDLLVHPEQDPEARYGVHYAPIYEAGGDFYDVFRLSPHTYAYFLGDISGHDLRASFLTSGVKALVREYFAPGYAPRESMERINEVLRTSFFRNGRHMTAVCLLADRRSNTVDVVTAGHPPVIHIPHGHEPQLVEAESDALGVFGHVQLTASRLQAGRGDRFLLYSDGLIEYGAKDGNRTQGLQVLLRACRERAPLPDIQVAVREVVQDVLRSAPCPVNDDIVALGVEM